MKIRFLTAALAFMLAISAGAAHAQQISLDTAIRNAAGELSSGMGTGTSIAVLSMQADSESRSNFLIDEMITAFIMRGGLRVVSRNEVQLALVREQLEFDMSGWVDDATAQSIGRFIGVQYIVLGVLEPFGNHFRFRAHVIEVETAVIPAVYTANNVRVFTESLFRVGGGVMFDATQFSAVDYWIRLPSIHSIYFQDRATAGFGVWAFFDARFLEVALSFFGGPSTWGVERVSGTTIEFERVNGSFSALDISVLLKYPFNVGNFFVFPLFGFGYNAVLSASIGDERYADLTGAATANLNSFRIQFGIGGDFGEFGDMGRFFIRASLLPYVNFSSGEFRDLTRWYGGRAPAHLGVTLRVGVGLRL